MVCCAGIVAGRSMTAVRMREDGYRIVKHLRSESYWVLDLLACEMSNNNLTGRAVGALPHVAQWHLLRRPFSGISPKVNRPFLCVAINLRQFCICERELLHRI